jgi:hypothetical protein
MSSHPVTFTSALALHQQEKRKLDDGDGEANKPNKKQKIHYEYFPLSKVCFGDKSEKYNTYGIVLKFTAIAPTKGKDHMRMAFIADESLTSFQVRFFGDRDALPLFNAVGDIVRLHRVMIDSYNNTYGLSLLPNFSSAALFDGSDKPCGSRAYWSSANTTTDEQDAQRVEELKKWFKENKDIALSFDVPTPIDEQTIQSVKSRPSSPVKQSNNANTMKSSPTKAAKPIVEDSKTSTSAVMNVKGTGDTIRTEVMNTVFLVKNNTNAEESADTGPLGLIKKEAPHYVPLGQLDPKTKHMVDLICKIELIAQETNLKKVWIWDGTCNPPGSMLLVVWNKSLPNFGNPTDKWVVLTRVKIKNYRNTIDLASTDKTTMRVLEDNSPLIVAALKANNVSYVNVPKAKNNTNNSNNSNSAKKVVHSLTVINTPNNAITPLTFVVNDVDVGKYRIEGTVIDYWPKEFTKFTCPVCSQCGNKAELSDRPLSLADWKCKKCSAQVKYQYRCAIKLRDESEELLVTIADEGADTFFKAIPPTDLTLSNVSVKTLEETMKSLLGMKVELCVMTYFPLDASGSKTKKRAQVFGTELKSFLFNNED